MTTQMETGVREMCNLSEGVYERAQAKAEAKANTKIADMAREMYRNVAYRLQRKGMREPEIAEMLDLSVDEVHELLSEPRSA